LLIHGQGWIHAARDHFTTGQPDRKEKFPVRIFGRLRGRRLGYAVTLAAAAALVGSLTSGLPALPFSQQATSATFDLDHGNVLIQVVFPRYDAVTRAESLGRPLLVVDRAAQIELPWFDALAPYHPTAVGIFSNLGRRPEAERTIRNKNIAVLYSAFTSLNVVLPEYKSSWLDMMAAAGLDPADTAEDPTTPSGIGIIATKKALAALKHDGTNRDGDIGGSKYNQQPYADYTGYEPVNSAYKLRDPSRWQPDVLTKDSSAKKGVFTVQQFAIPQFGVVKPFTYDSPAQFKVPPPVNSNFRNRKAYQQQADEVLAASANLTDMQKIKAEFFNDVVPSYGAVARVVNIGGNYTTEQTALYVTMADIAFHDTTIATYYYVRKYDAVRPYSAISYLYGNKKIKAWGGPGKGTVSDITGNEWKSYLSRQAEADYPEYPSATVGACLAFAQQARRSLGDSINITVPIPKGFSAVEPGVTPASDIVLHWGSFTEFAADCGQSRLWGGENFRSSIEAANHYGPKIGDLAYEFIQRKLNGN
jgi:hypothetical protein